MPTNTSSLLSSIRTSGGCIHIILHDSIGHPSASTNKRYTRYMPYVIDYMGGETVTAWALSAENRASLSGQEQSTPNPVHVDDANSYVLTGLTPAQRVTPTNGDLFDFGTTSYSQSANDAIYFYKVTSAPEADGLNPTANSNRRVAFRPIFISPEENGVPSQDFEWRKTTSGGGKGDLIAELNFATDCRTHYWNGGDPDNDAATSPYSETVASAGEMAWYNALTPDLITDQPNTGNDSMGIRLGVTSPDTIPSSGELMMAGSLAYRIGDTGGSDDWIGGSVLSAMGDNSFNLYNFADDTAPTAGEPKNFQREALRQWLSCITISDTMRSMPVVFWVCCATEAGSVTATVKADIESIFDNVSWACSQEGYATPKLVAAHWHYGHGVGDGFDDNDQFRTGMAQAAAGDANIFHVDVMGLTDDTIFDGGAAAQAYLADETSFSFGGVSGVDLSGGDLVSDGTHQTDENANAYFSKTLADGVLQQAAGWNLSFGLDFNLSSDLHRSLDIIPTPNYL